MNNVGTGNISYIKKSDTFSFKPLKKVDLSPFDFNIDCDKYEKTQVKRKFLGYVTKQD